jgi:flagellar biosynthetic protein FliO
MNVLKNCSKSIFKYGLSDLGKHLSLTAMLLIICINVNAAEQTTASNAINALDYFKVISGLVFVLALFLLSSYLYKRFSHGPMAGRGQLRVVDGLHLGSRERLILVELRDKQILLSITPGQINKIDAVDVLTGSETISDSVIEADNAST